VVLIDFLLTKIHDNWTEPQKLIKKNQDSVTMWHINVCKKNYVSDTQTCQMDTIYNTNLQNIYYMLYDMCGANQLYCD
jgi:hypothetical protein